MARRMTRRQLEQLAESFEPPIRDAFLRSMADVRNRAAVQLVADLIEAGRAEAVLDVLGFTGSRLSPLVEAVRASYLRTGMLTAGEIPPLTSHLLSHSAWRPARGFTVKWNFDITNPQAESWLREHSSQLVTNIVQDQRQAIRIFTAEGMALGRNPRQTALDIVGRVGESGRRAGGVVGLTSQQAQFVANARAELSDPASMAGYFNRQRRDKRFDAQVRKAMESGKPLTEAQIDRIAGRYADRLLALRGEMIARTESLTAMNAAREESYRQAIEAGDLAPENVLGTWGATGDKRTRDTHRKMSGQERHFGQPFQSPSGALLRFPGDTSLGAGAEETIGCRCTKTYRINYAAEEQRG